MVTDEFLQTTLLLKTIHFYRQPLVIGIVILNRISHMVTDEFLQTTLLLKPFIFTDNLCSL